MACNNNSNYLEELLENLKDTEKFLLDSANRLNWGDLSEDDVMDIGCGVVSLKLFETVFPKFRKVIAIDYSIYYIQYCEYNHFDERMEYHQADITDKQSLKEWKGKMSKIVSIYCLSCIKDQKTAIQNIKYLLTPGGEAVLVTGIENPLYESAKQLLKNPKWKLYENLLTEFPDHGNQGNGSSFYKTLFKELDLEIVFYEEETRFLPFGNEKEFRASKLTKVDFLTKHLPEEVQDDFTEEYMKKLMEINTHRPTGNLYFKTSTAKIIIRKKKK